MFERPIWIDAAVSWDGRRWRQVGSRAAGEGLESGGVLESGSNLESGDIPAEGRKNKKMMSHSAWLAYLALHRTLQACAWNVAREEIACFMGVGASGSTPEELDRIVGASLDAQGAFSHARFGTDGLQACNPLFAFQLMNNFTLCHASILERVGGPNAALYSRGVGTAAALAEACYALDEGLAPCAVAGAADTALHLVTRGELARTGRIEQGLRPGEGAAFLALSSGEARPGALGRIEQVRFYGGAGRGELAEFGLRAVSELGLSQADPVYLASWGSPAREALQGWLSTRAQVHDLAGVPRAELDESLAATAAVAWVAALERMIAEDQGRALVLNAGIDGGLGAVVLSRGSA